MRLLWAISAATAAELSLAGAILGLLSLAGRWNGWLDLFAQFAPFWLAVSIIGALLTWPTIQYAPERAVVLAIAALGVLANGVLVAPELARAASARFEAGMARDPLRILTFNVWDSNFDPGGTVATILKANADVVAIQEFGGLGGEPRARLLNAYPHWISCTPNRCDLVLLSKRSWATSNYRSLPGMSGLPVIWGQTTAPDGHPVTIVTTHLTWPMPPAPQATQRAALAGLIGGIGTRDTILTGDFNLAAWSAALVSQDRALSPLVRRTTAVFTWPANFAKANRPAPFPVLAIDQIYAGSAWRTVTLQRLPRTGSDHYGVLATFARAES